MEKRSSIKDSGLHALFRATEARNVEDAAPAVDMPVDPPTNDLPESVNAARPAETSSVPSGTVPADDQERVGDVGRRSLIQPSRSFPAVIRVVGVGGAGTNAINRMLEAGLEGVEFIAINTDVQALAMCEADHKLRIGRELTKGLGGGSDPKIGRDAAVAAYDEIKVMLKGSDMVFVCRLAWYGAPNCHDANYLTFHRVHHFRRLLGQHVRVEADEA